MQKDEFMFHRWSTRALIARREDLLEYVKQSEVFRTELEKLNEELLKREVNLKDA